ncbi:hypothetical protein CGQ36_15710 [Nocardiopsis dassonvillei]|nr:hypothetical protein CGQ36_15710 [Nocardiopsis dassonvillei]
MRRELGRAAAALHTVTGDGFGYPGRDGLRAGTRRTRRPRPGRSWPGTWRPTWPGWPGRWTEPGRPDRPDARKRRPARRTVPPPRTEGPVPRAVSGPREPGAPRARPPGGRGGPPPPPRAGRRARPGPRA